MCSVCSTTPWFRQSSCFKQNSSSSWKRIGPYFSENVQTFCFICLEPADMRVLNTVVLLHPTTTNIPHVRPLSSYRILQPNKWVFVTEYGSPYCAVRPAPGTADSSEGGGGGTYLRQGTACPARPIVASTVRRRQLTLVRASITAHVSNNLLHHKVHTEDFTTTTTTTM